MHFFPLSSILIVVSNLIVAVMLLWKTEYKKLNVIWGSFCLSVAVWGFGSFEATTVSSKELSFMWWQVANVSSIFTPIIFYQFVAAYVNKNNRALLCVLYFIGFLLLLINFFRRDLFIGDITFMFDQFYYIDWTIKKSWIYLLSYIGLYWVLLLFSSVLVIEKFVTSKGIVRNQLKYLLFAMAIGWLGPHLIWLPAFGLLKVYPYSNILMGIYPVIIGYAIVQYRLLDINVVIARTTIFVIVYLLVLGIPVWLGFRLLGEGLWLLPVVVMGACASAGPFIFFFFQRRAEALIQKEEHTMLEILKKASREIPHIKDLQHLFQFIRDNLQKLSIDRIVVYLWDVDSRSFIVKEASFDKSAFSTMADNEPLVVQLKKNNGHNRPLNLDEVHFLAKENKKSEYRDILPKMEQLSAQVIIPMVAEGALVGFIVLGKRAENRAYSEALMEVLSSIGTLAGSAVADYFYWGKMALEERRTSLDHLADSIAHEIDNPVTVIMMHSEWLEAYWKDFRVAAPEELKKKFDRSMGHVKEACTRISAQVAKVKAHAKGTNLPKTPIKISDVEESFWKLMGPVFQKESDGQEIELTKDVAADLPYVLGNKIELEQVFSNFLSNALHAVRSSKIKKIALKVYCKNDDWIRWEFADTGYGINPTIIKDIWLPHVTTKGSVEGSGLGLFIIRKIIESHQGRVWAESGGEGQGATMIVELPVFKGNFDDYVVKEEPRKGPKTLF